MSSTQAPLNRDSHRRSLLKAMSWRIIATFTTTVIAFFITGQVDLAVMIGSIEFVVKFAIYYGHERLWQEVPSGSGGHSEELRR